MGEKNMNYREDKIIELPDMTRRDLKTVRLYCESLYWDYSRIEKGKIYTYEELINLIRDKTGGALPKRTHGTKGGRDIQFTAWKITLDLQEKGETRDKAYFVVNKRNFSEETKYAIAEDMIQEYLLSRDNKSGLIYNIVLLLLMLRGKNNIIKGLHFKEMEFSKNKWEVEIGMVSRVFQKVLFNGNNILTQSIIGNILKASVDEIKKNIFLRALEFMGKDPDIKCKTNTKVLYIDSLKGEKLNLTDAEAAAAHKIKYQDKYYDYGTAYAGDVFVEMVNVIEEQILSDMEFDTKRDLVAAGKYPIFKECVAKRIADLETIGLIQIPEAKDGLKHNYKILNYWKVYEIKIPSDDLTNRVKKIITSNEYKNEKVAALLELNNNPSDEQLLDKKILEDYLSTLKKELNGYVETRVVSKVDLSNYDFESKEGESVAEELAWLSYFSKYAQYRVYSQAEWENFLLGSKEQTMEKDGVKFIYNSDGAISGMIDDNYSRINFETGEVDADRIDDITTIAELEKLAAVIVGDNKSIIKVKENYNKKMGDLIQSVVLSSKGEISEYGLDLEAMNKKIRELMEMQFKPQKNALKVARQIINSKKNKKD